jgi:hypothetical protein
MAEAWIVVAIIAQVLISTFSSILGAICCFFITTGIFIWGLLVYSDGGYIAIRSVKLSFGWFIAFVVFWYVLDGYFFLKARSQVKG